MAAPSGDFSVPGVIAVNVIRILQYVPGQHRHHIRIRRASTPAAVSFRMPASVAAEAGSHPIPHCPMIAFASAISCSDTFSTNPLDVVTSSNALGQETGSPILIAVASVAGCSTGRKSDPRCMKS